MSIYRKKHVKKHQRKLWRSWILQKFSHWK